MSLCVFKAGRTCWAFCLWTTFAIACSPRQLKLSLAHSRTCQHLFTFGRLSNPVRRNIPPPYLLVLCEDCHITPFPPPSKQTRPRYTQISCLSDNVFDRLTNSDFIDWQGASGCGSISLVLLYNANIRFAVCDAQCATSCRFFLNG